MSHARIQEFSSGGGCGVGVRSIWHIKKRSPVVSFKENYYLPRFQWGWNIFQGGGVQLFTGGPIAFSL